MSWNAASVPGAVGANGRSVSFGLITFQPISRARPPSTAGANRRYEAGPSSASTAIELRRYDAGNERCRRRRTSVDCGDEREPPRARDQHAPRPERGRHVRRLPSPRRAARRAAAGDRGPRRDAVHHPASHERAVDQAAPARARSRRQAGADRPARGVVQDLRARRAHPAHAVRAVGGARDDDAERVRPVSRRARQGERLSELPVSRARVRAGQQGREHAQAAPARAARARRAHGATRDALAL